MAHLDFSYEGENGPDHWKELFPNANGKHQSPIDIESDNAVFKRHLIHHPLEINYQSCDEIKNTGHSFQIYFNEKSNSTVNGGPVRNKHKFLQMHMHWGATNEEGSEHSIDGRFYPAELHFVNWNSHKYPSPDAAMKSNDTDGLLVLAVFAIIGQNNPEIDKIAKHFRKIHLKDQVDSIHEAINWSNLFPKDLNSFYTYRGSLTTPPCSECVRWVLFKDPIEISAYQLEELRSLSLSKDHEVQMMCNDRPRNALHHRKVFKSFE